MPNPVVFDPALSPGDFVVLQKTLSEFAWQKQIVGYDADGVYLIHERVARSGYYEFTTRHVPWDQLTQIELGHYVSIKRAVGGVLLIVVGVAVFMAGWVWRTHTGIGVWTVPVLGVVGGVFMLLGTRALRLKVADAEGTHTWMSTPFDGKGPRVAHDLAALAGRCDKCGGDVPRRMGPAGCPACGMDIGDVRVEAKAR